MTEVDHGLIEHNLNVMSGSVTMKQRKRGQVGNKNKAINEEVAKLVGAGILREAIFPTRITNPMMIKKHDGSSQM